jgi:hypothetical protein
MICAICLYIFLLIDKFTNKKISLATCLKFQLLLKLFLSSNKKRNLLPINTNSLSLPSLSHG